MAKAGRLAGKNTLVTGAAGYGYAPLLCLYVQQFFGL
jgi:hypothetical protein